VGEEHGLAVLELALREAMDLGHNYVGTEHILLGLIREERTSLSGSCSTSALTQRAADRAGVV
jgi:ATP-dependent Clp protease ATP-binding subunit ClpA